MNTLPGADSSQLQPSLQPQLSVHEIAEQANLIRQDIVEMLLAAGSGHPGGALGMADIFAAMYFRVLRHDPRRPDWPDRDRLVLSNGHICPVLYSALARSGYFDISELKALRKINSRLQGHPHNLHLPGIETSSGPLGQGLSQAIGMALAIQLDKKSSQVYCMLSDGEHDEGQIWEAIMTAGKYKLHNLAAIIDRNNIQIDGYTENIMPLESLKKKYEAFNWHVVEIDGHNIQEFLDACDIAKAVYEKPVAIIAHTIPGKGVDYMQWLPEWHGKAPNAEQAANALAQLKRDADYQHPPAPGGQHV